ncbi:uncharacterized protein LOC108231263 isoform X2 [Kryptolebias marmoratus]|uniref:uncharacterized protein LOC108231263 isoform X2 n=1 Tax=Kryptolebias marmoratus TaxID=37003 RepID=UPI0007F92A88|nr:uncharacterized protein LOC108231263 isoform X2 [Kryptolebias marmoratus]
MCAVSCEENQQDLDKIQKRKSQPSGVSTQIAKGSSLICQFASSDKTADIQPRMQPHVDYLKMLIIFYSLLMLRVGCCTNNLIFETKTVAVGDEVTLTCPRLTSESDAFLYWVRLVSGNWPEFLGGTFSFDYNFVKKTPHITIKQEPGTFTLHISNTKQSDAGLYYCIKVKMLNMTFMKRDVLIIKGTEPSITAIIQDPPSDPVGPGNLVTLQCSVLFNTEKNTCVSNHSVYWFRAGSDESHPSLIYTHGNSGDECERSPEAESAQKCTYSFSKNLSSSDAGTYYCAVATCGEILFGNGTRLDSEGLNVWNLQKTALFLLSASLIASVVVIFILTYIIKKKTCSCAKDAVTASVDQLSQKRD